MATPLARRPEPGDGSPQAAVSISAVTEYLLPATMRGWFHSAENSISAQ